MKKKFFSSLLAAAMVVTSVFSTTSVAGAAETGVPYGDVTVEQNGDSVTIGNDAIERTFSIKDKKLSTTEIVNKRTDGEETVFTPQKGSEEFVVKTTKEQKEPIKLDPIDRTGWEATADSYHNASGPSDGPASNLLDGNLESIWHTNYGGGTGDQSYPYNVVITFDGDETFQSFSYTPRQQGESTNGNIKGYELYASTAEEKLDFESEEWGEPIAKGDFEYNGVNPIYVNLEEECTAKQIKLVAISANNGSTFAGGAEFNLHKEKAPIEADDTRMFETSDLELEDENAVTIEDTTATINGVEKTGKKLTFSFKPYTHKEVAYTIDEVLVMYEGDHFMRKYLEIQVPDDKLAAAEIDYIDLESLKVSEDDAQWTIPRGKGGVVSMEEFKANLGQPIYIQGMFFGCEFPVANTEIVDGTGFMRYYSGKTFDRMKNDNLLTTDGKLMTWQTVAGAARSTEQEVIQADFFDYIDSIATPSEFRIQYNSWFDNMMKIDDNNILESFIEIDRELNKVEVRPLDSYVVDDGWNNYNDTYVVDAERSGTSLNETGFWEFNTKFPNKLTPSSELVQKFGSNFGVWVGPRGGYNFYGTLADILTKSEKGSKAGGSVDVADARYVDEFTKMALEWQKDYDVNYWKWDGFADDGQYNHFNNTGGADGVPVYSESNQHMTGGYHQMYHVTDLWEKWIDLMEAVRESEKENGINKLWISLTCYVNPSPWYLQWANSVWIQCVYDQKDANFGTTKMNKQITYRDACYYDFLKNHEFQFPLQNLYNHDPVYGKEGTGMTVNTATDEDFQNYLYMLSTRGTAFWELYYSDSIMTDGKYEVTAEFLEWAEENYHMLKNSKMIGGKPDVTKLGNGASDESQAEAYGFSCFDGKDGIISLRNPSASADKEITFTFDRTMGVAENAGTLNYYLEHSYLLSDESAQTGTLEYGKEYTVNLKPNEVRILRVSADKDTTAPTIDRIMTDGAKTVTVKFDEKVSGNLFKVENAKVASIEKSADDTTYHIELADVKDAAAVKVIPQDIKDMSGNKATEAASVVYHKDNVIAENESITAAGELAAEDKSLDSNNGFTVSATVKTTAADASLVKQDGQYELKVTADGKASFTLNGATAVSGKAINDGAEHKVVGVKENNGMLKLYVDGTLEGSAYNADNRFHKVEKAAITVGEGVTAAGVYDIAYGYDKVGEMDQEGLPKLTLTDDMITVSETSEGSKDKVLDGDNTTYWTSQKVEEGAVNSDNAWLKVDLGATYKLDQVDYTPRYYNGPQNYWQCTGNIKNLVVEISTDGTNWTPVTGEGGLDLSNKIVNQNDLTFFPEEITFEAQEARYVRISGTSSYHHEAANVDKFITVGDLAIYGEKVEAENIAKDANVVARWTKDDSNAEKGGDRPMSMAVNGTKNNLDGDYAEFGADSRDESSYMQVDLGEVCDIDSIAMYRYWSGGRIYGDTVIAVAEKEEDFTNGKATIVYNADTENFHQLNLGEETADFDEDYTESAQGKTWTVADGTKARFVRVYMHGSGSGRTTNHVNEIEVYGTRPEKEETPAVDITALIDRLAELSKVDTSNATTDSAAAFKAAIKEGYDLVAKGAETQDEVTAMLEKLTEAEAGLVDATALKTSIAEAEEAVKTSTTTSAEAVLAKIEEAKALLTNGTKEQVAAMVTALNEAAAGLVARGDVAELKALVDSYAKEELKADEYTTSTWNAYETALNAANAIIADNSNSAQADVDAAKAALEKAHEALAKRGNTDDLKTLIEEYKDLNEADYTAASWEAYETALNAANGIVADNSNSTQADVDAAKTALQEAKNALQKAPVTPDVDPSKLQAAIDAAKAVDKNLYTTDSYNAMKAVLENAEGLLDAQDQAVLDKAEKELNDAVAALVKRGNTDALKAFIEANKDLNKDDYTTDSWKAYDEALKAAEAIVKDNSNSSQEDVDAAKTALENAHKALVKVEQINKEALQTAIDAAEAVDESLYTTDSYKAMADVLADAKDVLANSKDQTEINKAAETLNSAVEALVERGNTDALKALIEEYKGLDKADYTEDSWEAYASALKAAEAIVKDNSNSSQDDVVAVAKALEAAKEALVKADEKPPVEVDKTDLQKAYDKYKDVKKGNYTDESWNAFTNALKSAKAILDLEDATQEQVNTALAQLTAAAKGLTEVPKEDPKDPSKDDPKPTPSEGGSVQTGDSSNAALWFMLLGASAITYVVVRRKRA